MPSPPRRPHRPNPGSTPKRSTSRRGTSQGRSGPRRGRDLSALHEAAAIDARYGLEPVFDPAAVDGGDAGGAGTAADGTAAGRFETLQCPYCGERFETLVDLSAGSADYIEDCQVCCQPIEFSVQLDAQGRLERLAVRRGD